MATKTAISSAHPTKNECISAAVTSVVSGMVFLGLCIVVIVVLTRVGGVPAVSWRYILSTVGAAVASMVGMISFTMLAVWLVALVHMSWRWAALVWDAMESINKVKQEVDDITSGSRRDRGGSRLDPKS